VGKIIEGLKAATKTAECDHDFRFERDSTQGGICCRCARCKSRWTAWPGSDLYDQFVETRAKTA
jgi:hypothetical protein